MPANLPSKYSAPAMSRNKINDLLTPLPVDTVRNINNLSRILRDAGYECYLVGGAVRDLLLGRNAGDLDITTNARPEVVQKLFYKTIPTGIKHGTVTALLGGEPFEITTYRAEGKYTDGRHPDSVDYSETLSEDLERRDFTVNALAYDPHSGELVDEHGGMEDIQSRRICTIGSPHERFFEDGLRPVRACRFATTLEFEVEDNTLSALKDPEVQKRTAMVAVERFNDELWKGFRAPAVSRMLRLLLETRLLFIFFTDDFGPYNEISPETLLKLDKLKDAAPAYRMSYFLEEILTNPGETLKEVGLNLKFSGRQIQDIEWYYRFRREQDKYEESPAETYEVRKFLSGVKESFAGKPLEFLEGIPVKEWKMLPRAHCLKIVKDTPLVIKDLAVNGRDLMDRGIQGREVGESLRTLLDRVLKDPELNDRERLLGLV